MRSKFLLYELFRIVLFEEIARKYRGKKKSEYRAQFVFVVLNGVPLEGGPHALDKGRRGEVEGENTRWKKRSG